MKNKHINRNTIKYFINITHDLHNMKKANSNHMTLNFFISQTIHTYIIYIKIIHSHQTT